MKPSGSASRKKARSASLSAGPAQPRMAAIIVIDRFRTSRRHHHAGLAHLLQAATYRIGCGTIGKRATLDTVERTVTAAVDLDDLEAEPLQGVRIGLGHLRPGCFGRVGG